MSEFLLKKDPPILKSLARDISRGLKDALETNTLSFHELSSRLEKFSVEAQIWDEWDEVETIVKHKVIQSCLWSLVDGISPLQTGSGINDLKDISDLVLGLLENQEQRQRLLRLKDQEALDVLDLLQTIIDLPSNLSARPRLSRILRKLSLNSGLLPPTLFLTGVSCTEKDACGGGGFADVWRGTMHGMPVALKRLRVFGSSPDREKLLKGLCREALIWRQLTHRTILPFLGVSETAFQNTYCLVSPWMEAGTIIQYLRENTTANRLELLRGIAEGMEYLHTTDPPVIHGDLRGANILVDQSGLPQITDFGLARIADSHASTTLGTTASISGATRWMAPELLSELGCLSIPSDVYSFGHVCLEVFTGKPPFANLREPVVPLLIRDGRKPDRPSSDATRLGLNSYFWDLMNECWSFEPSARPTMTYIVQKLITEQAQYGLRTYELSREQSVDLPPYQEVEFGSGETAESPQSLYESDDEDNSHPPTTADTVSILFYVIALYDYVATDSNEFNFFAGDLIAVTATPVDGWWNGVPLQGEGPPPSGTLPRHDFIFPSNYTRYHQIVLDAPNAIRIE